MKFNFSLIWATLTLIVIFLTFFTVRSYLRDQNKIQAAIGRANCQIQLSQAQQSDFSICQDIFNSTPRGNGLF